MGMLAGLGPSLSPSSIGFRAELLPSSGRRVLLSRSHCAGDQGAGLPRDKTRVAAQKGRGSGRGYEFRDSGGSGVGAGDFAEDGDSERR